MTYGEAWVQESMSLRLEKGTFVKTIIECKPEPMDRDDAILYYNTKLFRHWVSDYDYDEKISLDYIKSIVSCLMLGHKDRYKKYEESA